MTNVICSIKHVQQTIANLQASGQREHEGIVLWLGQRESESIRVRQVYEPIHEASADYFRISPSAMTTLKSHLRITRCFIAAQIHSHPQQAFHSAADNARAIVRHEGALSLVAPHFCRFVIPATFLTEVAIFQLAADNRWLELVGSAKSVACQIVE